MATTKRKLAEQILRIKAGGDVPRDFFIKPEEVYLLIAQATNYLLKLEYYQRAKEGDKGAPTHFIATFEDILVKEHATRGFDYIDLPADYVSLPHNKGVWHISPMGCEDEEVIIVENHAQFMDLNSVASLYENNLAAKIEGKKAIFLTDVSPGTKMLVKLIIADPNTLGENETFPCPPEMELQIIEMVSNKLPNSEDSDVSPKSEE